MKKNTTTILLSIFAVLVIGSIAKNILSKNSQKQSIQEKKLFILSNPQDINIIEVRRGQYEYIMKKEGDAWKIGKFEALPSFIENLFRSIDTARIISVAANMDNLDQFGLGQGEASDITLKKGDTILAHVKLGLGSDENVESYFGIRGDEKNILRIDGLYGNLFYDELRSALVEKVERDAITEVKIIQGKNILHIIKKDDMWFAGEREAQQEKIDDFLNRVSKITADDFPGADEEMEKSEFAIEITANGATLTLEAAQRVPNVTYYIKNSKGVTYILAKKTFENIFRDQKFFLTNF